MPKQFMSSPSCPILCFLFSTLFPTYCVCVIWPSFHLNEISPKVNNAVIKNIDFRRLEYFVQQAIRYEVYSASVPVTTLNVLASAIYSKHISPAYLYFQCFITVFKIYILLFYNRGTLFRLTITASCPMDLQYFPMDSQLCYIEIESCKYRHGCAFLSGYSLVLFIKVFKSVLTKIKLKNALLNTGPVFLLFESRIPFNQS